MNTEKNLQKDYIEKLRKMVPKHLIIEEISDRKKNIVNEFMKTRENLGFNFIGLDSHFGNNWNYEKYPFGNIMRNTNNNSIVGFMGTIYSTRQINNQEFVCCNLANFYVEKEFRMFSYFFFLHMLDKKKIIIYSHTPRNSIINIYEKLGFEIQKMKYTVALSINVNSIFSKNYKRFVISNNKEEIQNILIGNDKKIYEDHKKYNCEHFVILDKKNILRPCYFVAKKKKKYHIEILDLLYISNVKEFDQYAPEIFTKISFFFKKFFIGQRYFNQSEVLKNNPSFLTRTVEKLVPIKKFDDYYVSDTLYSDHVLVDA